MYQFTKLDIVGSSPIICSQFRGMFRIYIALSRTSQCDIENSNASVAQLVEHYLAKVDVVGSNPITRSNRRVSYKYVTI